MTKSITILGIDPGTATTGFGVIRQNKTKGSGFDPLDFGVIKTKASLTDSERLHAIGTDLEVLVKKFKPDLVGVEKLFFTSNQKTAMTVSQARGVVLYVCAKSNIPVLEFTPLQVKNIICGYGKADKRQVQFMVQKTFKLKVLPKPDDAADALAIALCAATAEKKYHFATGQN